ncbi:MAG: hypothetical protein C4560_03255 [Nitrospiraceae bacterium]|nr:MAG: hypothetical protein C4560_03255 [Nitrospiraceae bacterium]
MTNKLLLIILMSFLLGACMPKNYYPLKNDIYFQDHTQKQRKAIVMPFYVDIYTNYTVTNTFAKREGKSRDARDFIFNALKQEMKLKQYDVVEYIPYDEVIKDNFDRESHLKINELFHEFNDAVFSIRENLEKEKGKGFDYSVGVRAVEIAGLFDSKPDVLVFLDVDALVKNLTAMEPNAANAAVAVMTLGMSMIAPTPEDITSMEIALVDADTGDIIWLNNFTAFKRSVLQQKDMYFTVRRLLEDLPPHAGQEKE